MSTNSFEMIFETIDPLRINDEKYFSGHRRKNKEQKEDLERLSEHSMLCTKYFINFITELSLEPIIDNIISSIFGNENINKSKEVILLTIYHHDIGKLNPYFQKYRVKEDKRDEKAKHSLFSKIAINSLLVERYPEMEFLIFLMSNIVERHHMGIGNISLKPNELSSEETTIRNKIFDDLSLNLHESDENNLRKYFRNQDGEYWLAMTCLIKLLHTLLCLSDFYSTYHFSNNIEDYYKINRIDMSLLKKMKQSLLTESFNNKPLDDSIPTDGITDINTLRSRILNNCLKSFNTPENEHVRIFMLSVPTGGGKTNIATRMALELMERDQTLRRFFYVLPYINIVEQNSQWLQDALFKKDFFNDGEKYISCIHSASLISDEQTPSGEYYTQKEKIRLLLDDEHLNNPVNVITNVNFFNTFIKINGQNRYKLAHLANSVVIIDEIQSLGDSKIRLFYKFIETSSRLLNIRYILMSATLPNINYFVDNANAVLIPEKPEKYFLHPVFKRNTIIFKNSVNDNEGVLKLLNEEAKTHTREFPYKALITVNTVRRCQEIASMLNQGIPFGGEIILVNSTLPSFRRRKIIETVKNWKKENGNLVIVSTQSIEAGMNIDCDFGIRDFAILESIEQISGRINRECSPEKSQTSHLNVIKLTRDNISDACRIYSGTQRYKLLQEKFRENNILLTEIIEQKKFNEYYSYLAEHLKKIHKDILPDSLSKIKDLQFDDLDRDVDVIDESIQKIDIFYNAPIPFDEFIINDLATFSKILNNNELKKYGSSIVMKDGIFYTYELLNVWKNVMHSTHRFDDKYIRKMISGLIRQFIIGINNICSKKTHNNELRNILIDCGLITMDEDYGLLISTEKFKSVFTLKMGFNYQIPQTYPESKSHFVII